MPLPSCWTQPLPPSDTHFSERARQRQHVLTKPRGSLGQLEDVAMTLAGLQRTQHPQVDPVRIAVFAADHGVCAEGVSAYPQEVTAQMIANFASGGAAISV
ncbi:MAG: nicotinate-nucleotide--dimethylbenzimidazole phosphoribosyltransferase, partial [Marinobacter sp.]